MEIQMDRTDPPFAVACQDGAVFNVELQEGDTLVVLVAYPDPVLEATGLLAHVRIPVDGPYVELVAPPVQHVREYTRRHGGVSVADDGALSLLKDFAGREGLPPLPFGRWPRLLRPGPTSRSA